LKIRNVFEPAGEECGTLYDETTSCELCGANRKQISPLTLKYDSIPKKDISKTIAGEIVVSEKFVAACKERGFNGLVFENIIFDKVKSNFFQLTASSQIELSNKTIAGINPFDLSTSDKGEIYKCPNGHNIGLNLLSEPCVLNSKSIVEYDFFASKQKVGVKRGLIRPEPIYICSQAFRKMIEEEKLSGFEFEITNIE
jgi:ribosomal protein S14